MKLENRFTVPVPRDQALQVLLDVERIAPCMPGAALTSREGDHFTGTVKVKVGPINLTYGGKAHFVSVDEAAGVVIIEGSGKETRGTGTAKALVTCRLVSNGETTDVEVDTDLNVTGKPASFGRGVLADVSGKLVGQFASCLAEEILAGTPEPAAAPAGTASADAGAAYGWCCRADCRATEPGRRSRRATGHRTRGAAGASAATAGGHRPARNRGCSRAQAPCTGARRRGGAPVGDPAPAPLNRRGHPSTECPGRRLPAAPPSSVRRRRCSQRPAAATRRRRSSARHERRRRPRACRR